MLIPSSALPAVTPIAQATALLLRVRDGFRQPQIICGVSGKDSLTVLSLCCQIFGAENVHGFFLFHVPDLECEQKTIRMAESRFGIEITQLRHPEASFYLQTSTLCKLSIETENQIRRKLRWGDIEAIMRKRTGAGWFAYGHRMTDSPQRRAMIKSHAGIIENRRTCFPIYDWKPRDVIAFLRARRISIPAMFGSTINNTSGVSPNDPKCLRFLRDNHPQDYAKLLAIYPGAANLLLRDELREKYGVKFQAEEPTQGSSDHGEGEIGEGGE
ncbi:MAG: phosphoadenosine phosphosulfate reductase family protein [Planctomycetota bacterium]|nr:phosphoadenosine phosphosulfate reductase family protein [Planctomycetota bacterium]